MASCDCTMFQAKGICWHTGYDPNLPIDTQVQNGDAHVKASRTLPDPYNRRADFLEYLEELKPGSSQMEGK